MSTNLNFDHIAWKNQIQYLVDIIFKNISNFHFSIYAAKNYDFYRKPLTGLWNAFKNDLLNSFNFENNKVIISKKSFFCGDAAGRIMPSFYKKIIHKTSKKGDFSDTDFKFALNINLRFITLEKLCQNIDEDYNLSGFDPYKYKYTTLNKKLSPCDLFGVTISNAYVNKSSLLKHIILIIG